MTVVLAKRFGAQIELMADTMITDRAKGRDNALPGRLKVIPLSANITVAYAGHSDPALYAIRELHRRGTTNRSAVLETLRVCTESSHHDVDFLVASHQPDADLRRVWSGRVSEPLEECAIGNSAIRQPVYDAFNRTGVDRVDAKEFSSSFLTTFTNPRIDLGLGVGGFPVRLEASPDGHVFRHHSFHFDWKPIDFLGGREQHQNPADMQTGDWTYHHTIVTTKVPGVAVLAAQLQQARRAYVYVPLLDDDPSPVSLLSANVDWTEHQQLMHERTFEALDFAVARMTK